MTEKEYQDLTAREKEILKEKILLEFISLPSIKKKISIMCARNAVKDTMFLDDASQELFLMIWRKSTDEIINCYYYTANGEFNPAGSFKRLTALATTILGRAILSKNPSQPEKYNHSLLTRHKHYTLAAHIAPIPGVDAESSFDIAEPEVESGLWDIIRAELNNDELELLYIQLERISKGSKHSLNPQLKNKIEKIVREKKLIMTKKDTKKMGLFGSVNQQFENHLNPIMVEFSLYGTVAISTEAKQVIRQIYKQIYPGVARIDLSCGACVMQYLRVIQDWVIANEPVKQDNPAQAAKKRKKQG